MCAVTTAYQCNECIFLKLIFFFYYYYLLFIFLNHFLVDLVKAKPIRYCMSENAITNFRSFRYLDFELSFQSVRKTGDFAMYICTYILVKSKIDKFSEIR